MYGLLGLARLLSGVTLLVAGWFLLWTWVIRGRWATPLVPYLFILSGVCTAVSGACAVLIAVYAAPTVAAATLIEVVSSLRWITGKVGFVAAGLALIVAARYQWRVGGMLRRVAPASAVIGVAMQFIWLDAVTIIHAPGGGHRLLPLVAGHRDDARHRPRRTTLHRDLRWR